MLFLYNVVGYYGIYLGLSYQSNLEIKAKLDANAYSDNETLTIKMPYTLPYQMDWKEYERVDGEFQHNGEFYRLVKHKLEKDTLFVVYIKDHREADLFKALVDFVQASSDSPISQKAISFIKSLVKDYIPTANSMYVSSVGWCKITEFPPLEVPILKTSSPIISPPPEVRA
jgi:hypothetical protein